MTNYKLNSIEKLLKYVFVILGLTVFLFNTAYNFPEKTVVFTAWIIIGVSLYLLIVYHRKWEFFMIFILMFAYNYSIMIAEFISPIDGSVYTVYCKSMEAYIGENIILLYLILLCAFMPTSYVIIKEMKQNIYNIPQKTNDLITIVIIFAVVYIMLFEYNTPEAGQRGTMSTLYEYAIIFFIIGFLYSKTVFTNLILTIILILFALQNFVYGGRVVGLLYGF